MRRNFYLSPIFTCLALTISSNARAAEPVPLQNASFPEIQKNFQLSMPGSKQGLMPLTNNLQFITQHTDLNAITHIRMQQQYQGFSVIGGYAILHSKQPAQHLLSGLTANPKVNMTGLIYQKIQDDLGQASPDFIKKGNLALSKFKEQYQGQAISEEAVTPVVFIDDEHKAHWAYKISLFITHPDKIPERPTAYVNADTYEPFVQWDDVKTAQVPAKGVGFGGNSKVGETGFGKDLPELDISRDNATATCFMSNKNVKVVDMEHDTSAPNNAMSFDCKTSIGNDSMTFWTGYNGDGYDRENGAFSPTNDALYAGHVIKHMYLDWYNVEALEKANGKPMKLIMRVHYGYSYENAFWDGRQMTFGDGEDTFYPLVSLGVAAHEVSHGFTEQHSSLEYRGQSGGMNESFSDMAAQAADYYSIGTNNWMIGAEITKEDSGLEALRYMDKPSRDGRSIDSADKYRSGLNVHYSSGVFNRLFYLIATKPNWNTRKAFDVMVKANMDYWTPSSTFNDGGCGVLQAAKDLNYSLNDVKSALDLVAVKYKDCNLSSSN